MIYLIVKMLVLLFIAGGIGVLFGWLIRAAHEREAREASEREAAARLAELRTARDTAESKLREALNAPAGDAEPDAAMTEQLAAAANQIKDLEAKLADAEATAKAAQASEADKAAALASAEARIVEVEAGAGGAMAGAAAPAEEIQAVAAPVEDAATPVALEAAEKPSDGGDDLRQISGVGPKLETLLHDNGIWTYRQIADLTPGQIAWLDDKLTFPGRIEREDWIGQAKKLMAS